MRILVDSCSYTGQNVGDLAMLRVAVSRLRQLWPDASIQVITDAPQAVAAQSGSVEPVPVRGRRVVLQHRLLGRLEQVLPASVAGRWRSVEDRLHSRYPGVIRFAQRLKFGLGDRNTDGARFLDAIDGADLVAVCGSGVMTDAFAESALGVLATLDMAIERGIPTAMFGQGLGPIVSAELRARAAEVLPRVRLVAVRERLASLPLLASLGMRSDRIIVTGDDAIELALQGGAADGEDVAGGGRHIGVNLRVAPYSEIGREHFETVREALRAASQAHGATLAPVPIAHKRNLDVVTLRDLLAGLPAHEADGGASLNTPDRVIRRVSECRVVVTGSYHGGVFALAQGIPTVALASSRYYVDKMTGLADQFGAGCDVLTLERGLPACRIRDAISAAWESAPRLRPALRARAAEQVDRARAAYALLPGLVAQTE